MNSGPLRKIAVAATLLLILSAVCHKNNRPDVPARPDGPEYGLPDSSYAYTVTATDPDGDNVSVQVSWGDTSPMVWSGLVASGTAVVGHKAWHEVGGFAIRVRARDSKGAVSDWSPILEVRILDPDSLPLPPSTLLGPDSTCADFIAEFSCIAVGPPGEYLEVYFDWGEGSEPGDAVTGQAGETLRARHAFATPGVYYVRAQACDSHPGTYSDWTAKHRVEVRSSSGGWARTYPAYEAFCVAPTTDGGLVLSGWSDGRLFLAKTDASGNPHWMRNYSNAVGYYGFSVRQTADGGFIAVSADEGPFALSDICLTRTDTAGYALWYRRHYVGSGEFGGPYGRCVRPTPDGGYVIAACELVMKTDSLGNGLWMKPYSANAVELTPDGGYIICGTTLIKTDALGNVLWESVYSGTGSSVRTTRDGGYLFAGECEEHGSDAAYAAKTDGSGNLVWERASPGIDGALGYDITEASDGGCYLVGETQDNEADAWSFPYLVRMDANGEVLWHRVLGGPEGGGGWSVTSTDDGGCVVAGYAGDYDESSAVLFKVDPQGHSSAPSLTGMIVRRPPLGQRGSGIRRPELRGRAHREAEARR